MRILVTGAAGFIGAAVAEALLKRGDWVYGIDSINAYYDVDLKFGRLERLGIPGREALLYPVTRSARHDEFIFQKMSVEDECAMLTLCRQERFDAIVHLAAQAGVRYSLENPRSYIDSNIVGIWTVLEACRHHLVRHLVFASSSSVYGELSTAPFSTYEKTDSPMSFYAATKKSGELMAYAYAHLFRIPTTGLRYFTVYGPWGRPDMALHKFTEAILKGNAVELYHRGKATRDWTYIDDAVEATLRVLDHPPPPGSGTPFKIYNVGFGNPAGIDELVCHISTALKQTASIVYMEAPAGDVPLTASDTLDFIDEFGQWETMSLKTGVENFVNWYLEWRRRK